MFYPVGGSLQLGSLHGFSLIDQRYKCHHTQPPIQPKIAGSTPHPWEDVCLQGAHLPLRDGLRSVPRLRDAHRTRAMIHAPDSLLPPRSTSSHRIARAIGDLRVFRAFRDRPASPREALPTFLSPVPIQMWIKHYQWRVPSSSTKSGTSVGHGTTTRWMLWRSVLVSE